MQARGHFVKTVRALYALSRCNEAVLRAANEHSLYTELCSILVEVCGYRMAWIGYPDLADGTKIVRPLAHAGYTEGYLQSVRIEWSEEARGLGPAGTAVRTRQPSVVQRVATDRRFAPWKDEATKRGYGAVLALPILDGDSVCAVLTVYATEPNAFDSDELELLTRLADNISYGVGAQRARQARHRAEKRLREANERLRTLYDASPDTVLVFDCLGQLVEVNRSAAETLGYSRQELLTKPMPVLGTPAEELEATGQRFCAAMAGADQEFEWTARAKDGREFAAEVRLHRLPGDRSDPGEPCVVAVIRDIGERRHMEQEMLRVEKLKSLTFLAGGIAHDFNNMLTGIMANVSLAQMGVGGEQGVRRSLEQAERACQRARDLTRQLMSFAKGSTTERKPMRLERLLEESSVLSLRGSRARGDVHVAADLWGLCADEGQIGQVLQNLVLNADQAMPEGGTIRIRAENIELAKGSPLPLAPGRYVRISVSDEGAGIAPDVLPHIFDPFFTTKKHGTGLGLSTSFSIVRAHDGHIAVHSTPGQGTRFEVYLPADPNQISSAEPAAEPPKSGRGNVLVMDDDDIIREATARMLRRLGYEVDVCRDGAQALERYAEALKRGQRFDAVILDLTVPGGMGGADAVKELLKLDPSVCALASSGYAQDPMVQTPSDYGFRGAVAKPYSLASLRAELGRLLPSS